MNENTQMSNIVDGGGNSEEIHLLESEIAESAMRKKHFLDYDYDQPIINDRKSVSSAKSPHGKSSTSNISAANNSSSTAIDNNGSNATMTNDLSTKKKFSGSDRPSTSSSLKITTTIEQKLNSKSSSLPQQAAGNNNNNVESIFSMLGAINSSDVTSKFLEISKNREMCATLRLSGCISLLVQILHSDLPDETKQNECLQALHNIINCHPDDKAGRREARVLKLIEQVFDYCYALRSILRCELSDNIDRHPIQGIGTLMKISFDEEHRYAMCHLGALQTIATLIQLDHAVHGAISTDANCITMRRYAGMCLTNLTFGDGNNKALLCSNKSFMRALVDQINSQSDELVQVTASVIRNLSWRADPNMKDVLSEIGTVSILANAAMKCAHENTLKAILSALWNLSNHCTKNKAEICEIDGALEFLIDMLSYEAASKTTNVIENAGGILRNISTYIALHEELRVILRGKNCLAILLQQLKSSSLTIVSNACGTLGNLSANCADDQKYLRDNGAIPMLRSLIYSKHKMISTGSTIALRHLLACKPSLALTENLDSVAKMMDLKELPTLNVRKQRALEQELNMRKIDDDDDTSPMTKDDRTKDFATTSKEKLKVKNIEDEDDDAPTNFSQLDTDGDQDVERTEESNLDQITDYSVRYAENDYDDERSAKPVVEDSTKSYHTEGTPHAVLSKAGSMSDLRKEKLKESVKSAKEGSNSKFAPNASGFQSPEKTVNYCVEGTPGNFSRNDSLSDLEDNGESSKTAGKALKNSTNSSRIPPPPLMIRKEISTSEKESTAATPKSVTFGNLADETPLMFSRTSSIGSLDSAEQGCVDDKSSVVSDFSRLASGMMSPSELPDSPTQSIPQSPSRLHSRHQQSNRIVSRTPPLPSTREVIGAEAEAADDSMNAFHVENTPAVYSYATSLSNLSFDDEPKISTDAISKDYQLMKQPSCEDENDTKKSPTGEVEHGIQHPPDTADHSETESDEDGILLESCINMGMNRVLKRDEEETDGAEIPENRSDYQQLLNDCITNGMQKFSGAPALIKDHPLDMMRAGAPLLPPYLPVVDELNKFICEDSPCNFSVMSGLSAITIESHIQAQQISNKQSANKPEPKKRTLNSELVAGPSNILVEPSNACQQFDDSLSSLSVESDGDDGNVLSQVIAAGVNKVQQKPPERSSVPINIPVKPHDSTDMCNESISSVDSNGRDDATSNSLLEQCIQSGINKVVKKDSSARRSLVTSSPKKSMLPKPGSAKSKKSLDRKDEELLQECIKTGILIATKNEVDHLQENITNMSLSDPISKNGESTSVIAQGSYPLQCASTITDVEVDKSENSRMMSCQNDREEDFTGSRGETSHQASWATPNGYDLNLSFGSTEDNILERSNEYPVGKLSIMTSGFDIDDGSESMMEISNEFMVENERLVDARIDEKHKDPDLMMKSVERLTQELISTAEYLRKTTTVSDETSKMSGSNTWNDEVSFPSISLSAPMIGSTNDETTFVDQVNSNPLGRSVEQQQNLDDKTPTNENFVFPTDETDALPKIDFHVGGEIGTQSLNGKVNFMSYGPTSIETNSTMSNSTIVQVEAKRIANRINSMTSKLVDSTTSLMDLERVRPPSSMDCMSWTADSVHQSPMRKRPSMTGIIAKRAIGHQVGQGLGSVESVNSMLNLDSIRPPSLMDELLDSMISVDSIVSEIVDPTLIGVSHYETALSDMEDSLTLRSCQDLSKDETLTGTSDDFSSVESTPRRRRNIRSTTPKQRRQSEKDRYKTYTIQMDMILKQEQQAHTSSHSPDGSPRRSLSARQRRQEDRSRYESQTIDLSPSPVNRRTENPDRFKTFKIEHSDFDDDHSIRAMTENFEFLRNATSAMNSNGIDTNEIRIKLNKIRNGRHHHDDSLEYERQTSETESQRDARNSSFNDGNSSIEQEDSATSTPTPPEPLQPKVVKPKLSYVSPYRMTTAGTATKVQQCKTKLTKVTKAPIIVKAVNRSEVKTPPATPSRVNGTKPRLNLTKNPAAVNAKSSIPKPTTTPTLEVAPQTPPIRQGTFIQDEPTLDNVPIVHDILPPTAPVTSKVTSSKLKPPNSRVASSTSSKTPSTSPKKNSLIAALPQLKFRSNSNASMKPPPIMTVKPVRSNTGINLSNQRKNVTSKIAGLWKNGNANDKKESPTTKKPISNVSSQVNGLKQTPASGGFLRRAISTGTKEKIKRSSTCEEIV